MLDADVLAVVFRVRPASEAVVEELLLRKAVCKMWKVAIELATADKVWLAPFSASGKLFISSLPALVREVASSRNGLNVPQALAKHLGFEASIEAHFFHKPVVCRAFRALESVVRLQSLVPLEKAFVFVVRAMQAHPRSRSVLASATDLLIVLAGLSGGPRAFVDAGAVRALMAALAFFGPSSPVLNAACALMNIATTGYTHVHTAMVQAGFVPVLLGVMQRHPVALNFQLCAMRCVRILCRCEGHALVLREAGMAEAAFELMKAHPFIRQVHVDAVNALLHMEVAQPPGEGVDFFAASRGMRLVIDSSLKFCTPSLSLQSIRIVMHLRDKSRATTARLIELGAVHFALFVMRANPNVKVVEAAARVLDRLSAHILFPTDPDAAEVEAQVALMLQHHAGNNTIQKFAQKMHKRFARRAKLAAS
jgi:hypothetical protein